MTGISYSEQAAQYRKDAKKAYATARKYAQWAGREYKRAAEFAVQAVWVTRFEGRWVEDAGNDPALWERSSARAVKMGDTFLRMNASATEQARFYNDMARRYDAMARHAAESIAEAAQPQEEDVTANTAKVQWKKKRDCDDQILPGEWAAFLGGVQIASCSVYEGTPTGYYGRYRGSFSKVLLPAEGAYRKYTTDTLRDFKLQVQGLADQYVAQAAETARVEALVAQHPASAVARSLAGR